MLALKKIYCDELLHFALLLSLLRLNTDYNFETDLLNNVSDLDFYNGTSWVSFPITSFRPNYIHPKSLDSVLLNYERDLFADLNSLGRYNAAETYRNQNITAYLLSVDRSSIRNVNCTSNTNDQHGSEQPILQSNHNEVSSLDINNDGVSPAGFDGDLGLTQEDMDLIEVLWKQDVDLGFSLQPTESTSHKSDLDNLCNSTAATTTPHADDDIEKLKTLKALNQETVKEEPKETQEPQSWNGLNYTIDTETGEYVIKTDLDEPLSVGNCSPSCDIPLGDLSLPESLLQEALQLVGLDDDIPQEGVNAKEIENISLSPPSPDFLLSRTPEVSFSETTPLVPARESQPDTVFGDSTSEESTEKLLEDLKADEDLNILTNMIQTSQFHHSHHRAFQSRMPFVRTVSMEQRWQDLASLLSIQNQNDTSAMPHPFSHHSLHNYSHPHSHAMGYSPDARGVLLHNATLTPPMGDLNTTVPYSNIGGTNLGNAVATSMNLTNSSEPMGEHSSTTSYKLEPTPDMMYYQNTSSELNQNDGFLSSILNDDDLQLMDMAMNEGMYTMRMLDSNNALNNLNMNSTSASVISRTEVERVDTSSDSAVSSMGSERVSSLSDGEWCDAGSDSGHTAADHYVVDYHTSKYRPYDYSYTSRQHSSTLGSSDTVRMPPVAQKKHQMFGKRYFQEQGTASSVQPIPTSIKYEFRNPSTSSFSSPTQTEGAVGPKLQEVKYSCSMEFNRLNQMGRNSISHVQHNHTYHLPAENTGAMQRPVSRDKIKGRKVDEHLTRDEKRARSLSVPISVDDIINLPMDEFNERLSKYDLSETQLSLIRDIRRRGKNKVAAQNCRKRKLDQILSLADEVKDIRDRKIRLLREYDFLVSERQKIKDKYEQLYRHVFQHLRDPDGNPYSPYEYSLQVAADGSVSIVPCANNSLSNSEQKEPPHQNHKECL